MTTARWDPFRELMTIQDRVNRLFQDTLSRQQGRESIETGAWAPAVDIFETHDRIVLRADLPGIDQDAIELRVEDNNLILKGERKAPGDVSPEEFHRAERPYGPFVRSFSLPGNVDQTAIRATHKNGVLEVVLPKKQESRSRPIRVDVK
jgi:HSP20 family protein